MLMSAAPPKLIVVASVFTSANVVLGVVSDVVIAGLVPNTKAPVPVSSEMTPASSDEEVAAKSESLLLVRATVPVASGNVIERSAVGSTTTSLVS